MSVFAIRNLRFLILTDADAKNLAILVMFAIQNGNAVEIPCVNVTLSIRITIPTMIIAPAEVHALTVLPLIRKKATAITVNAYVRVPLTFYVKCQMASFSASTKIYVDAIPINQRLGRAGHKLIRETVDARVPASRESYAMRGGASVILLPMRTIILTVVVLVSNATPMGDSPVWEALAYAHRIVVESALGHASNAAWARSAKLTSLAIAPACVIH